MGVSPWDHRHFFSRFLVAVLLDAVVQYLLFDTVYVLAAVVIGTLLMGIPYTLARAITNRIATRRRHARHEEERRAA